MPFSEHSKNKFEPGDKVRFYDRGKYYEERIHSIENNEVATIYKDGDPFYIQLVDLIKL